MAGEITDSGMTNQASKMLLYFPLPLPTYSSLGSLSHAPPSLNIAQNSIRPQFSNKSYFRGIHSQNHRQRILHPTIPLFPIPSSSPIQVFPRVGFPPPFYPIIGKRGEFSVVIWGRRKLSSILRAKPNLTQSLVFLEPSSLRVKRRGKASGW